MDEPSKQRIFKIGNPNGFPSSEFLVQLYSVGAIACLLCSFVAELDSNTQISCILLSLLMGTIGAGISLIAASSEEKSEDSRQPPLNG